MSWSWTIRYNSINIPFGYIVQKIKRGILRDFKKRSVNPLCLNMFIFLYLIQRGKVRSFLKERLAESSTYIEVKYLFRNKVNLISSFQT